MKKALTLLLICLMVFAVAACASAADRIVIRWAAQADQTPGTQAVIDGFNAAQDKYTVEWVQTSNVSDTMREQLITSLRAGSSEYDVILLDVVWAGEFAAAGYIDPIDRYMRDAGLSVAQFNSGSMASGRYAGRQYVLPMYPDLGSLYFRKDIVSDADAAKLISGGYSPAFLLALAEKYKGQGGTTDGLVYQSARYEGLICNVNEFTDNFYNLRAGLEAMKQATDSEGTPADILNYMEDPTYQSFVNGRSVFARNWPYQWGGVLESAEITTDQVEIAPLPYGGSVGGWLLAMNVNSENKEGAWEFMKYAATDGQKPHSITSGRLPGFNALMEDPDVVAGNELLSKEGFKNALANTMARPLAAEYAKLSDTLQEAIYAYLTGTADIDTTVAAVEAALAE